MATAGTQKSRQAMVSRMAPLAGRVQVNLASMCGVASWIYRHSRQSQVLPAHSCRPCALRATKLVGFLNCAIVPCGSAALRAVNHLPVRNRFSHLADHSCFLFCRQMPHRPVRTRIRNLVGNHGSGRIFGVAFGFVDHLAAVLAANIVQNPMHGGAILIRKRRRGFPFLRGNAALH